MNTITYRETFLMQFKAFLEAREKAREEFEEYIKELHYIFHNLEINSSVECYTEREYQLQHWPYAVEPFMIDKFYYPWRERVASAFAMVVCLTTIACLKARLASQR